MPKASSLRLALGYLFTPGRGALEARRPENLRPSLLLYLAASAASLLFWTLIPRAFPAPSGALGSGAFSLPLASRALSSLWTAALELAGAGLTAAFALYLKSGRPAPAAARNLIAAAAATAPLILLLASYAPRSGSLPVLPVLGLAAGAGIWLLRRGTSEWRPPLAFLLGLNAASFILLPALAAAFWVGSEKLYQGAEIAGGLWILWATARGLGALAEIKMPRAFLSIVLALIAQISLALAFNRLGLLPVPLLKAVMYE